MAENNGMTHRQQMLRKIQMEDFACFEAALYLDSLYCTSWPLEYQRQQSGIQLGMDGWALALGVFSQLNQVVFSAERNDYVAV